MCEACSHVGALLYAVDGGTKMRDSVTCTGEKSKWIMPKYMKTIPYLPVSEMDFISAKQEADESSRRESNHTNSFKAINIPKVTSSVTAPSRDEQQTLFANACFICKSKPIILSLVKYFHEIYIPKVHSNQYPNVSEKKFTILTIISSSCNRRVMKWRYFLL